MSLKPPFRYQFISAPADNTKEMTLQKLKAKVATGSNELAEVAPLPIPDFKVGTLDSLVQASDELSKVDSSVESIVKRLAENVKSLLESNEAAERARTQLLVNDRPVDAYVRNFSWNSIKYRTDKPIKEMAEVIAQEVNNIDINVRNKMATYSNVKSNIAAMERKKGGNLAVKNVSDLVKKEDFVLGSEYLQTIVLAVPKLTRDEFLKNYERLTQMVVPRSAKALVEDDDFVLYAVVVFKRVIDEFNAKAREYKCIPRDFVYDEQAIADEKKELSTAASSAKEQRNALLRLCKTNFSEAFAAWVHIKALRIFVESILRYGLPPNFQAAVLKPHKGKQDKLLSTLCQHYQKLGPSFGNGKDDNPIEENLQGLALDKEFFPFVRFELVFEE